MEWLIAAHDPTISSEFPLSTACLWYALNSVYLDTGGWRYKEGSERVRRLSLTWSLMRKTVLVNKGREVARLREVLLVGVQLCIHVVQSRPLVTGGGCQLLFIGGVIGGRIVYRRRILEHKGGGGDGVRRDTGGQK